MKQFKSARGGEVGLQEERKKEKKGFEMEKKVLCLQTPPLPI
jgi:hypothetical protein